MGPPAPVAAASRPPASLTLTRQSDYSPASLTPRPVVPADTAPPAPSTTTTTTTTTSAPAAPSSKLERAASGAGSSTSGAHHHQADEPLVLRYINEERYSRGLLGYERLTVKVLKEELTGKEVGGELWKPKNKNKEQMVKDYLCAPPPLPTANPAPRNALCFWRRGVQFGLLPVTPRRQ
jgi:hypothetical protein